MTRTVSRFFAAVLTTGALVAASGCNFGQQSEEGRLELWHAFNPEETIVFEEIVREYEEQYEEETGRPLEVNVTYVSYGDMFTKLKTAALGKLTPDVAFVDSIKVTDLAFGQALVPLAGLEGFQERYGSIEEAQSEFVRASFDAGLVNRLGELDLYALPVQTTTVSLFWNRSLFRENARGLREAGLDPNRAPETWDELLAYAGVLTDAGDGVYGFGMSGSLWFNFPLFNMYEVQFVEYTDTGQAIATMETANGMAALQRMETIVNSGFEGGAWRRSALSPEAGFLNEKYAMIMTGPWMVESFANQELDFDISLIPAPTQEEVEALGLSPKDPAIADEWGIRAYSSSNVGGQSGVILRTSQNQEAAYEFLEYFTSETVQRRWASSLGQIPVRLDAWDDLDTTRYPFMTKFMDQLRLARRIPQIPLYGILESNIYNPEVDLFLKGDQEKEQMLDNMDRQMQRVIFDRINEAIDVGE